MLAVIAVTLFTYTHTHAKTLATITHPNSHVSLGKASAYDHLEHTVVEIHVHRDQPLREKTICCQK
jgi:hypothetical protein